MSVRASRVGSSVLEFRGDLDEAPGLVGDGGEVLAREGLAVRGDAGAVGVAAGREDGGSVYPGATMIEPQCMAVMYRVWRVVSWPPLGFWALVMALKVLSASFPVPHRPPSVSMKARIWLAAPPKRVGR